VTEPPAPARPAPVERPIPAVLLALALPVLASQALRLSYQWVDALWVRGLGVEATAAITTSIFVLWAVYSLNDVFAIGVIAYVSQLLGAGERARAGVAAFKGIRASFLLGLIGTACGVFLARPIYGLMTQDPRMIEAGSSYLSILLGGAPLLMVALTCEGVMRAAGDTRTPLLLDLFAIGLNAVLDPILIYGWGPAPALGVAGAAWATIIAQAVLVASYLTLALRGHPAFPLARRAAGPPIRIAGMARVGAPAAVIGVLFSAVYVAFARSAAQFGGAAMAVVGIANRIEALQFISSVAIGSAGASVVGQSIGAGRPDRAVQALLTGVRWNLWLTGIMTVLFLAIPGPFIALFTQDPEVMRLGVPYLRILALCFILNGVEIVTAECILGSGHTVVLSTIFTSFSLVRIPLAFLVPAWTGSGVLGIAWVITVTCAIRGLLIIAWAARGTWKSGLRGELHGPGSPVSTAEGA
jgi:putative MATE family efflux protein